MKRMLGVVVAGLWLGCGGMAVDVDREPVEVDELGQKVIYGTDDRQDVHAHPDATLRARARQSTVALVQASDVSESGGRVTLRSQTLREAQNLCAGQRFAEDPTAAFCSGTLIDDDLVLTAGHCITSGADCTGTRFVFNYLRPAEGQLVALTSADVFRCARIVAREDRTASGRTLDYAIIQLDRKATPRFTPAPVRAASTALRVGQNVAVIGSGSGVPFKVDSGGRVRVSRTSTLDYFEANTDTFGGNSGSGVYETEGHTVAGILVRGDTDYRRQGSCNVVNVCGNTTCDGEAVTYVRNAIDALCRAGTSARLCGSAPPPGPTPPPSSGTRGTFTFSLSGTSSATTRFAAHKVTVQAGQTLRFGTCGVAGSQGSGDTFLRLRGPSGTEVAKNDDACGNLSAISFRPRTASGVYELRAGCFSSTSCSGTVAWAVE